VKNPRCRQARTFRPISALRNLSVAVLQRRFRALIPAVSPKQSEITCITAAGACALEDRLLDDLRHDVVAARRDLTLLQRPVLVVVSSGTLRRHLAVRIARRLGPSVLGLTVTTVFALAREILERAGESAGTADVLFETLARREALEEEHLADLLADLHQGPGLAAASIRDLISAGFTGDGKSEARELIQTHPDAGERRRALAVLAATGRTTRAMERLGIARAGNLLQRAAEVLHDGGAGVLPCRGVRVHGFADATGQSAQILLALLHLGNGRLYLDQPPDPARPGLPDGGVEFVRDFAHRLVGETPPDADRSSSDGPRLVTFSASGADGEVRETAYRIRELLDLGAEPERIGFVARNLPVYAASLRRYFTLLGIPFSGGEVPPGYHPESRRLAAALEILERGPSASIDCWLDALHPGYVHGPLEDLRLGLRALGVVRLGEVVALDPDTVLGGRASFSLPARRGFFVRDAPDDKSSEEKVERRETAGRVLRRRLSGDFLRWALHRAAALVDRWSARPRKAGLEATAGFLADFLAGELGWKVRQDEAPEDASLDRQAQDLLRHLPGLAGGKLQLQAEELPLLLRQTLAPSAPLGGGGAGVQVMDSAHARGCTFEHLFVVGLNRDLFPRSPTQDPLLPDGIRRLLAGRLPHLHAKGDARMEERYLFAALLASAPQVTLSWQRADEDGREKSKSPFLTRLEIEAGALEETTVPRELQQVLSPPWTGGKARPRSARDAAQLAALTHARAELVPFLSLAAREAAAQHGVGVVPATGDRLSRLRLAVLEEWEPDRRTREGQRRFLQLGPYLGFVGSPGSDQDPRHAPLFVTRLEAVARCPWQTFLQTLLRVQPVPDPSGELPGLDALILGNTVHRTLEQLFGCGRGEMRSLSEALKEGPVVVPRPQPPAMQQALQETATAVARDQGIHLPGMHRALVRMAGPYIESAVHHLYKDAASGLQLLGSELEGSVVIEHKGETVEVRFRTDQAMVQEGTTVLTDFKTGKPLTTGKKPETRAGHLLKQVRQGIRLQAPAYAAFRVPGGGTVEGRYLFVKPELEPDFVVASTSSDDAGLLDAFAGVVLTLRTGMQEGVFFPRLENAKGGDSDACSTCDLLDACGRQESGVRRRLAGIALRVRQQQAEGKHVSSAESQVAGLWFLEEKAP